MTGSTNVRELWLAYRLGELAPAERQVMEERMLADQEFSDELQDAEHDLIDDYHAQRLSRKERRRVQAALPPERLAQWVGAPSLAGVPRPHASAPWSWIAWSAIAALLLIALGGWLVFSRSHSASQDVQMANNSAPGTTPQSSGDQGATAVLLLDTGITRGPGGPSLVLTSSTRLVRVQWVTLESVSAQSFQLLVTDGGKTLRTIAQEPGFQTIDGHQVAEFRVDPSAFGPGDSHLLLAVQTSGEQSREVAEFPLTVTRK